MEQKLYYEWSHFGSIHNLSLSYFEVKKLKQIKSQIYVLIFADW